MTLTKRIKSYCEQLKNNKEARNYLQNRGFPDIDYLIDRWSVGCSTEEGDYFQNYITLPIFASTQVVSITSRSFNNSIPPHKHNSGKIDHYYNHRDVVCDNLIVVESPLCALSLLDCDFTVVATMGTGKLPTNYRDTAANTIFILPDSDPNDAGLNGAKKIASLLYKVVETVRIAPLPKASGKVDVNFLYSKDKTYSKSKFIKQIEMILDDSYEFVPDQEKEEEQTRSHFSRVKKDKYDITDVISSFLELETRGQVLQGLCPFHNDNYSPSFTVYPETHSFYCFGCQTGGDVYDFIQNHMGFSFTEAKEYLQINYG